MHGHNTHVCNHNVDAMGKCAIVFNVNHAHHNTQCKVLEFPNIIKCKFSLMHFDRYTLYKYPISTFPLNFCLLFLSWIFSFFKSEEFCCHYNFFLLKWEWFSSAAAWHHDMLVYGRGDFIVHYSYLFVLDLPQFVNWVCASLCPC